MKTKVPKTSVYRKTKAIEIFTYGKEKRENGYFPLLAVCIQHGLLLLKL